MTNPETVILIRPGFFDVHNSKPKQFHHYRTKMPMNSACEINLPINAYMAFDAALKELFEAWGIQCGMQNHHAYEFENGVMILFNDLVIRIDHISSWPKNVRYVKYGELRDLDNPALRIINKLFPEKIPELFTAKSHEFSSLAFDDLNEKDLSSVRGCGKMRIKSIQRWYRKWTGADLKKAYE